METKMIGNKIAKARKDKQLSQAQLAESLFISPQAVGKWERGESLPDLVTFSRLAGTLGVDLNYFSDSFQSAEKRENPKLNWNMSHGNWVDADFSGLKDLHERLSSSNMQRCKFVGSQLAGLLLKSNHIDTCDFSGADLSSSRIQESHLVNDVFKNCLLKEAVFSGSHIKGGDFSGADLTETIFKSCGFEKNAITGALLNRTTFITTHIADVIFEGIMSDCSFDDCAFTRVTFQNAILTNTFFKCRRLKKLRFTGCKADRLTYEFLKNGKADLTGIGLLAT